MDFVDVEGWVQTYSGRKIYPLNPDPEQIVLLDIAHHLSLLPRFHGATEELYSVAQHSLLVCEIASPPCKLEALMHDAHEYLLGDIRAPIERALRAHGINIIDTAKTLVQRIIMEKFGHSAKESQEVKTADHIACVTEARDLMYPIHPDWKHCVEKGDVAHPKRIIVLSSREAEIAFLRMYQTLTGLPVAQQSSKPPRNPDEKRTANAS